MTHQKCYMALLDYFWSFYSLIYGTCNPFMISRVIEYQQNQTVFFFIFIKKNDPKCENLTKLWDKFLIQKNFGFLRFEGFDLSEMEHDRSSKVTFSSI